MSIAFWLLLVGLGLVCRILRGIVLRVLGSFRSRRGVLLFYWLLCIGGRVGPWFLLVLVVSFLFWLRLCSSSLVYAGFWV